MPKPLQSLSSYADDVFKGLDLPNVEVSETEFHQCVFRDCSLKEAAFRKCRFVECQFYGSDLSLIDVAGSAFIGVSFEDCTLVGVNWARADWSALNLGKSLDFRRCALSHSTFLSVPLKASSLIDCVARNVDFREADLTRVDLSGTDLSEGLFQGTNLRKANLSSARNYAINPDENSIAGAKFALPEAMSLLYNMDIELVSEDGGVNSVT